MRILWERWGEKERADRGSDVGFKEKGRMKVGRAGSRREKARRCEKSGREHLVHTFAGSALNTF